jgi:CHASE2 domain-containing sensor protein
VERWRAAWCFLPGRSTGSLERTALSGWNSPWECLLAFTVFPVATLLLGTSFPRDRRWLPIAAALLLLAVAAAISLIAFIASQMPVFITPGPPILLGLSERVLIVVYAAWLALVAVTLLERSSGALEAKRAA